MAIISTMNGYSFVGTAFLEIVVTAKSAAIAIIMKSNILLSPRVPEVTEPMMLSAGMHRRMSKIEDFSMFMLGGLLFLFLMYAITAHVNVKMFIADSRNISESGF